jgi:hypothetical protein
LKLVDTGRQAGKDPARYRLGFLSIEKNDETQIYTVTFLGNLP